MIKNYRERPLQAVKFTPTAECFDSLSELGVSPIKVFGNTESTYLRLRTSEGDVIVNEGDYVIKDANGEIRCSKPEAFESFYEVVE